MKKILRNKDVIIVMLAIFFLIIWIGIISLMINFYKDWKCNNTDDIEWFVKNSCARYIK